MTVKRIVRPAIPPCWVPTTRKRRSPKLSPDVAAQLEMAAKQLMVDVIRARFEAIRTEIQWRGVQRDAMTIFAFTVVGVVLGSLNAIGMWAGVAALPVTYLASMWLHHDRRIGSLGNYLLTKIEPAMNEFDGLPGLEEFLDGFEKARKTGRHFSSIMSRLLFPSLQLTAIVAGIGMTRVPFGSVATSAMMGVTAIMLVATGVTFTKVKHIRTR